MDVCDTRSSVDWVHYRVKQKINLSGSIVYVQIPDLKLYLTMHYEVEKYPLYHERFLCRNTYVVTCGENVFVTGKLSTQYINGMVLAHSEHDPSLNPLAHMHRY